MAEPPGIPSALGIESVEWLAEGGENITVRVTGRWRRRRPTWSAQPVLVVEVARREAERLNATLEERERTRRVAEQRAHAEQALRRDLTRQLAARDRGRELVRDQLAAAEERVRELEIELGNARRRGDEAEQL